jgi:hypothetical protein
LHCSTEEERVRYFWCGIEPKLCSIEMRMTDPSESAKALVASKGIGSLQKTTSVAGEPIAASGGTEPVHVNGSVAEPDAAALKGEVRPRTRQHLVAEAVSPASSTTDKTISCVLGRPITRSRRSL